jgi:hypothetical protein
MCTHPAPTVFEFSLHIVRPHLLCSFAAFYNLTPEEERVYVFTPAVLFPALLYFASLTFPLFRLPQALADTVVGLVSTKRVQAFLQLEERPADPPPLAADVPLLVEIVDGSFCFSTGQTEAAGASNAQAPVSHRGAKEAGELQVRGA